MKMTISQRVMALALVICLLLSMVPTFGFVPKVEAVANQWTVVHGTASQITADANTPSNATFDSRVAAYYDQKIDVVDGIKISFKVNFPTITSGQLMQYGFALVDRAGSFHTYSPAAGSMALELVSTVSGSTTNPLTATASKKPAGGNRGFLQTFASALANPRNTTDVYDIAFEKINVTESGVNYSWKVSVSKQGGTVYTYRYKASDIPHDMFANGAYLALGSMAAVTHKMAVSDLKVTQSQPAADPKGWNVVSGAAAGLVPETAGKFNASFSNYVTGYYNDKIDVEEGTTISFKVNFPKISDGVLLQYCFSLVDRDKSFYTSNTVANSMSLELTSTVSGGKANPLTAIASKKLAGASSRTWLANVTGSLATRNTADVYDVTFKKINETEGGVNYSWLLTVAKGSTSYSYKYKASDIPHNMFENGAYLALGSMAGSTTHTVKVSDLSVKVEVPVVEDPEGWNVIAGTAAGLVPESAGKFNASFTGYVTGYYNDKIDVVDGTTISFKTKVPTYAADTALHFGYSLVDADKSFCLSDTTSNALSVELTSTAAVGTKWPVRAVVSKKVAGGAQRAFMANIPNPLAADRSTTDVYTITFQKIRKTVEGVDYSWCITVDNGKEAQTYLVKASDIAHDLYKDGLYLAAGALNSATGHTVNVSDLTVTVEDLEGWNVISGTKDQLTVDVQNSEDAKFTGFVTGYYNNKITVENGTTISFKAKLPAIAENTALHFGISLIDAPKSFFQTGSANALSVELQSTAAVANKWPMRAVVSRKIAGGSNREWMGNIPNPLSVERNTTDVYTITFQKVSGTVGGVEYSWKVMVNNGVEEQVYLVETSKISHDLFKNGLYLAAGAMNSATGHAVSISDLTVTKEEINLRDSEGWNVIAGTKDRLTVDTKKPENVTFTNYVTGYYNNKIAVEDGTAISFKVKFNQMTADAALHYGFSLVDTARSFYMSDTVSNALSVELQSATAVANKWPVRAVVSKKVAGGSQRAFMGNIPNALAAERNTTDVYTVTFQKVSGTVDGVEYSWKITVNNGKETQVYLVKASDVSHDLFKDGLYLAAGALTSVSNHTVAISDLTVKKAPVVLSDPEGWNVIAGAKDRLTVDAKKPENATFTNYVTGYYNNKIAVEEGTTISFDVSLPVMAAGEGLHYGFSLVDKSKSFFTSDTVANSLNVELQSIREVNKKWPVNAVFSLKKAGVGRVWIANLGNGMSADRNTKATYTITYRKINETVDNINYSWYVTISDGTVTSGYGVKTTDVPHDRFVNGAYLAAGTITSVTNHTMKISNMSVKVSAEKFDTDKLVDLSGIWKIVRGYSGIAGKGLTMKSGKTTMEGFGGIAYMKESVKNAVSVEFELNNYNSKNGDFFSFGLVNKQGVYYTPDGKESQGFYVRIKEVNGVLDVVLYTVTKDGSVAIGGLTSTSKAKDVKHTLTFFKSNGKWHAALDGKQKLRIDENVDLKDVSYLVAGATMGKEQSMTVHNVYVDNAVTDSMKAGTLKAGYKVNGFQIVRGYGVGGSTTGKGLTDKSGKTMMQGYGGIAYKDGTIKNAVAVDFELNKFEGSSYFFSFGLVNKEGAYYTPNGNESQGIFVRIKSWQNGQGMNVTVFNLTKAGSEELGTIVTKVPPVGQKHNLSIFREDGVWYVGIDGNQKMQLNVEVDLDKTSYLCAGASTTPELTMTVHKVYIDGKVTKDMKGGAVVQSVASGGNVGGGDTTGGTGLEKGEGNAFFTRDGNDGEPGNLLDSASNGQVIILVLCSVVVCAALAAGYLFFFIKNNKKETV